VSWNKLWATNRDVLDPVVPRYVTVPDANKVEIRFPDFHPKPLAAHSLALLPKKPDGDKKMVFESSSIWIDGTDAKAMKNGEEVTLMGWGNIVIEKIHTAANGAIAYVDAKLNLEGSVKKTDLKATWVPNLPDLNVKCTLVYYSYLLNVERMETKKKKMNRLRAAQKLKDAKAAVANAAAEAKKSDPPAAPEDAEKTKKQQNKEKDDEMRAITNKDSCTKVAAIGECAMRRLHKGDVVQLLRLGYFRVDSTSTSDDATLTMIHIPDGKEKAVSKVALF